MLDQSPSPQANTAPNNSSSDGDTTFHPSHEASEALERLFDSSRFGFMSNDHKYQVSIPIGWTRYTEAPWSHISPGTYTLPEQGWKIHISATENTAPQSLSIVSDYAFSSTIPFKHLTNVGEFRKANSKYFDRGSAGKFITLYPATEEQLRRALEFLEEGLNGFPGPYILSDVKYGEAPVYLRYGAFRELSKTAHSGAAVLCIRDAAGNLVEDDRSPAFTLPDFVTAPEFLKKTVDERLNPTDDGAARLLDGYTVERALHFSNGGGVYLLQDSEGKQTVLKEGRALAGIDHRRIDAYTRVISEHATLKALSTTSCTPAPRDIKIIGNHAFLFEEYIQGQNLHSWISRNFPFSYSYTTNDYETRALSILTELVSKIDSIHAKRIAIMDLQPFNVIIEPDDHVRIIDLESSCGIHDDNPDSYIGTPGYIPNRSQSPLHRDYYALLQLALYLFCPVTSVASISHSVTTTLQELIEHHFTSDIRQQLIRLRRRLEEFEDSSDTVVNIDISEMSLSSLDRTISKIANGITRVRASPTITGLYGAGRAVTSAGDAASIATGLSGVLIGLDGQNKHLSDDLDLLEQHLEQSTSSDPSLMTGALGGVLTLAKCGRPRSALALYPHLDHKQIRTDNLSLRTGKSGLAIGQLELLRHCSDTEVQQDLEESITQLVAATRSANMSLHSPGSSTQVPLGLFDGWSGVALALAKAGQHYRDRELYQAARVAIDFDYENMTVAPDNSLQADDGIRMLPYLDGGSAGLGVALSSIPRSSRRPGDTEVLKMIARACVGRAAVGAGLLQGRSGLLFALTRLDIHSLDGLKIDDVLDRELRLLSPMFFRTPDEDNAVYVAGSGNQHLSVNFEDGASGVLFALKNMSAGLRTTSFA